MPIHLKDGASFANIGKVYVKDGASFAPIVKIYDFDGTNFNPIYASETIVIGAGAEATAVSVQSNWTNQGATALTVTQEQILVRLGGGQSQDYCYCRQPLPRGSKLIYTANVNNPNGSFSLHICVGTTPEGDDISNVGFLNETKTVEVPLNSSTDYYFYIWGWNTYSPDTTVTITSMIVE